MGKKKSNAEQLSDPGFFGELVQQAKMVFYLLKDGDVPIYLKALPLLAIGYLLSPIDFIPDGFLGFGQMDDLAILLVGAKVFIELAPQDIVNRYLNQMRGRYVEGSAEDVDSTELPPKQLDEIIIDGEFEPWDETADAKK